MRKYSLIHTENIPNPTKIDIWELCQNGKSLLQIFIDEHQNDALIFDKIAGALSIIEITSNLLRLPKSKFRLIEFAGTIYIGLFVFIITNGFTDYYLHIPDELFQIILPIILPIILYYNHYYKSYYVKSLFDKILKFLRL